MYSITPVFISSNAIIEIVNSRAIVFAFLASEYCTGIAMESNHVRIIKKSMLMEKNDSKPADNISKDIRNLKSNKKSTFCYHSNCLLTDILYIVCKIQSFIKRVCLSPRSILQLVCEHFLNNKSCDNIHD